MISAFRFSSFFCFAIDLIQLQACSDSTESLLESVCQISTDYIDCNFFPALDNLNNFFALEFSSVTLVFSMINLIFELIWNHV